MCSFPGWTVEMFRSSRIDGKIKDNTEEDKKNNGEDKKDFTKAIFSIKWCQNQTETTGPIIQKSLTELKSKTEKQEINNSLINNLLYNCFCC